jgi:hypothetical protein
MAVWDLFFQNGPETGIQSSIFEKTMAERRLNQGKVKSKNQEKFMLLEAYRAKWKEVASAINQRQVYNRFFN